MRRAVRAALFDRKVHTELAFDSDATADAVMLVAGVAAVVHAALLVRVGVFSASSLVGLLEAIVAGLVGWLILAGATWLAATKLFGGSGQIQTMLRLHGHATLPLILNVVGIPVVSGVALVWMVAALVPATMEGGNLELPKAVASVLVGLAAAALFRMLFQLPFLAFGALF